MPQKTLDHLSVEEKRRLLADLMRKKKAAQRAPAQEPVSTGSNGGVRAPLSSQQQRLWLLEQLNPGTSAYNIPLGMMFTGSLDVGAWQRSFRQVVLRHDILRTYFTTEDETPFQVVESEVPEIEESSFSHLPRKEAHAAAVEAFEQMAASPFDLTEPPPWRAQLLHIAPDQVLFAFVVHHIVFDGWSSMLFLNEVIGCYRLEKRGTEAQLSTLPLQYADFARWQRKHLSGEPLEKLLAHWRKTLEGVAHQDLPTDRPRPAQPTQAGAHLMRELPEEHTRRLKEFSRKHGAISYMVLVATVQLLLSRYCSQRDIVVGSSVIGRPRTELEKLIGFFINTLALRSDVDPDLDFAGFVREVRKTVQTAMTHQDMPFERLAQELGVERVPNRHPVFQVCLNHIQVAATEIKIPDAKVDFLETSDQAAKFDLLFDFRELPTVLRTNFSYNSEIFDRSTIEQIANGFERLLITGLEAPHTKLRDLPLIGDEEFRLLTREWAVSRTEYPRDATLVDRLRHWARETPDAVATQLDDEKLTYGALGHKSARLAHRLLALDAGSYVGVCTTRGPQLAVAMAGVLQAGSAYVPLDPEYPAERLRLMAEDADLKVILTDEASAEVARSVAGDGVTVVRIDEAVDDEGLPNEPPILELQAGDAANLIFTSGSTGRPKGTVVNHRGIVRLVVDTDYMQIKPDDRVAQLSSISFDATTWEVWTALANGARLVFVPRADLLDPDRLRSRIEHHGLTTMLVITAPFHQLVRADPTLFAGLRNLLFGGETADPKLVRAVLQGGGAPERLINAYGPTENTVIATWHLVEELAEDAPSVPVGRPVANTTVYVVDPWMRPAPVGVPGELLLGGDGIAQGYHGRPGLTAERFVPDPFGQEPGGRLYRTGDRVRWTRDGRLEFLGRVDHQVKIRGHRIELREVESSLLEHPEVREAVVLAKEGPGGQRLLAYWSGGADLDSETLTGRIRRRLPSYMVPSSMMKLDRLPINANGKVDRRALPEPSTDLTIYVAPRNELERRLVKLWSEVLERPKIGVHEDFFALGGHSLLAVQLVSRARGELEINISVRHLLEAPTIAGLAASVEEIQNSERSLPPMRAVDPDQDPPLSFAQERMWLLEQMLDGQSLYTIPMVLRFGGDLDVAALKRAFGALVEHHESLRTLFIGDRDPRQRSEDWPPTMRRLDVSRDPVPEARARREITAEIRKPFDLRTDLPIRALLLTLGEDEFQWVVCVHHIVTDGWSVDLMLRDLASAYNDLRAGRRPSLAKPAWRYVDFAAWQREHLETIVEEDLRYWREVFPTPPPALELPTDRHRPARQSFRAAAEPLRLSKGTAQLKSLATRESATPFMTVLALFQLLLSRWSGQQRFAIGSPVAGRDQLELEDVVGLFVNTVALNADLEGRPTFRQLLRRSRDTVRGALAHQAMPFDRLVEELQPTRATDRSPIFQVMLSVHGERTGSLQLDGLDVGVVEQLPEAVEFDLVLSLTETADGFEGGLTYATDLFDRSTVVAMLKSFGHLLEQGVADPDRPIDQLDLSPPEQRRKLLTDLARSPYAEAPVPTSPLDLIEAHFAAIPDATAITGAGLDGGWSQTSYAELQLRARSVAERLVALGVELETRVGVALPRSPETVVTLLGILQAGGAFVPLDASYPDERLRFLVEDAILGQACSLLVVDDDSELQQKLGMDDGPRFIAVTDLIDETSRLARAESLPPRQADRAAYVIYTSGSTGKPKGVVVPHVALAAHLVWLQQLRPQSTSDVMLHRSSLSFDVAVEEIFWPLSAGARIETAPMDADPWQLVDHIIATGVTVIDVVPSLLRTLLDVPDFDHLDKLHTVLCGGEELSADIVRRFRQKTAQRPSTWPTVALLNMYGPTETTITAVGGEVDLDVAPQARIPLGLPATGIQALVLDDNLRPVPVGAYGELCLSGTQLARGYLNRTEVTAERFVPHPFGRPEERLYRTGDRVRRRNDGSLVFAGRLDDQVKLRGFRIEPGEVEAVLLAQSGVAEAVVTLESVAGHDQLVARLSPAPDRVDATSEAFVENLRAELRDQLPAHMVPAMFQVLDALPRLPSGKLDRRSLPPLLTGLTEYEPPKDETEQAIAGTWAEGLGVERVGRNDDFFLLGGHSLLAAQVTARLRDRLGIEVSVLDLLEAPTVELLGHTLRRRVLSGGSEQETRRPSLVAASTPGPHRLSFHQERLWFLDQRLEDGFIYHVPMVLELRGELDAEALERALAAIVDRHEVLRGRLVQGDDGVWMHVGNGPGALPRLNLSAASEEDIEARLLTEARRPLDLSLEPMLRTTLVRIADRGEQARHLLLVVTHHSASDGISHDVFLYELATLYDAFRQGLDSPLPAVTVQYSDFARWQRDRFDDRSVEHRLEYWRAHLSEPPPVLELPFDRPRSPRRSNEGGWVELAIEPKIVHGLRRLARDQKSTLFMAVLGCWQGLLHLINGQDRIAVGTQVSDRPHRDLERVIGLFVNELVLCTDVAGAASFRDLLDRARDVALGAFANQDLPFEQVVRALRPQRHPGTSPLFQTELSFYHAKGGELALPGLDVSVRELDPGGARYDLSLVLGEHGDALRGAVGYRRDLFDEPTVRQIAFAFQGFVTAVVEQPDVSLNGLDLDLTALRAKTTASQGGADLSAKPSDQESLEPLAERLASVWAKALKLNLIELDEDFFELGGHSLAAAQTTRAVARELGAEVPISLLFEAPTPAAYARAVRAFLDSTSPETDLD